MVYDYILKNGTVINFQTMQTEIKDIYIKDGVFAEETSDATAQFVIDAKGKYVLPGLVDEHVHLNVSNSNIGSNADLLCIPMGVTTAVDAGTCGWTNFEGFYNYNIVRYVPNVLAYLHVSPYGVHSGCIHEENHDPADFNEREILKKALKYRDTIVGLKVRMCKATLGDYGIAPLKRTVEIADKIGKQTARHCVVDVHYDDLPDNVSVQEILDTLRAGDVITHVMQTHGETMFESDGSVRDALKKARKRGIWVDDCHGRVHWSFANLKNAYADGFYPDIISSDVVRISTFVKPGSSLVHAMCVNSAAGMKELDIFKAVTYTPAKALGILDRAGTLDVGKPADVCIMDVQQTNEEYQDWWGGTCKGNKCFVPLMTLKDGVIVYRQTFF
jgi:predicted amidohydrolase